MGSRDVTMPNEQSASSLLSLLPVWALNEISLVSCYSSSLSHWAISLNNFPIIKVNSTGYVESNEVQHAILHPLLTSDGAQPLKHLTSPPNLCCLLQVLPCSPHIIYVTILSTDNPITTQLNSASRLKLYIFITECNVIFTWLFLNYHLLNTCNNAFLVMFIRVVA